jgi:hypothetical protein
MDLFKLRAEDLAARMSGWLNRDHLGAVAGSAGIIFVEEMLNSFALTQTGIAAKGLRAEIASRSILRLLWSGINYFALKNRYPALALISSSIPVVYVLADLIAIFTKHTAESAGAAISSAISTRFSAVRAVVSSEPSAEPTTSTAVSPPVAVISIPAPQPQMQVEVSEAAIA